MCANGGNATNDNLNCTCPDQFAGAHCEIGLAMFLFLFVDLFSIKGYCSIVHNNNGSSAVIADKGT